jgi:ubiquitin carboxyl-terminal hydrolase 5/13
VPAWNDRVRKTECVLSFDSPESPNGLFVSLTTFQGFGNDYVDLDFSQNQNPLYLWIKWNKIAKPVATKADGVPEPTKLGIGIEGGFQVEDEPFEFEKTHFLAIMPSRVLVALPNAELPDLIDLSVQAIFKASDLSESDAQVRSRLSLFEVGLCASAMNVSTDWSVSRNNLSRKPRAVL